ncbi:MAG TPA: polysaccharide lyase [Candidatus Methylacidiphilales bacterium]|nr:polysaccharide lyase [Candidatus Methylacidiphilales bacterium]
MFAQSGPDVTSLPFADADGDGKPDGWNPYPPGEGELRVLALAPGGGLAFKDNDKNSGLGIERWIEVKEGMNYTASAAVTGTGAVTMSLIFAKEKPQRPGDLKSVQLGDKSARAESGKTTTVSSHVPAGAKWMKLWFYCPKIGITDVVINQVTLTVAPAATATPTAAAAPGNTPTASTSAGSTSAAPAPSAAAPLPAGVASVLDFETGDLSQAHQGKGEGAYVSVVSAPDAPVREGKFSAKTALSKEQIRAEVPGPRCEAYGITRYGWSMFVPKDFDALTQFSIVTQWHSWGTGKESPNDGGPPTCLVIDKGNIHMKLLRQGDEGWTSKADYFQLGSIDDMRGVWTDWVLEINWQGPGKGGWLKLYKNDKLVVDHKGTTWYDEKDKGPYFKFGIYKGKNKWKGEEATTVLYFDSARMALGENSTYKMVAPSAYSPRSEK